MQGNYFSMVDERLKSVLIVLSILLNPMTLFGVSNSGQYSKLERTTKESARNKLKIVLSRYCGDFCQIVGLDILIDEKIPDGEDMGFEGAVSSSANAELVVSKLTASIQIDERVGHVNRDRLNGILNVQLGSLAEKTEIIWKAVKLPRITRYAEGEPGYILDSFDDSEYSEGDWNFRPQEYSGMAQQLRSGLKVRLTDALSHVISQYCPTQCILERVDILGSIVGPQQASRLPRSQQIRDRSGRTIFQIDNIEIDVTMDTKLDEQERSKIAAVMRSKVRFASPINFNLGVMEFPTSYAEKVAKDNEDLNDPYGLNKLRNMLIMFRDLAGTKEVINTTETNLKDQSSVSTSESARERANFSNEEKSGELQIEEIVAGAVALLLVLGLLTYGLMKVNQSRKDAAEMMQSGLTGAVGIPVGQPSDDKGDEARNVVRSEENRENLLLTMKVQELKDELIETFVGNPKVAKDTFSRFIKEDGIEDTAKYVHVFGHLVVFEMLKDPNFKRELYELSEYYHNSDFEFTLEEELELLSRLKTRCTASEIRLRTRKSSEKFEFLHKLDSVQIYNLIRDEKIQVQAIVMTQLDHKKRQRVFDMYMGSDKVLLMSELSSADAIPKEFLFNVAKVLNKKVSSKPEFDTENLRTSDILLDLMEKAPIREQKDLMSTLQQNNPETARSIKLKLVTVNMLPYLKDGHLLELVLGMDREDLLVFLSSTEEFIRDLILRKAPEELSDSWLEDLGTMTGVDESSQKIVEMKVLNKVRSLAHNGVINLLEINSLIFEEAPSVGDFVVEDEAVPELNDSIEAA